MEQEKRALYPYDYQRYLLADMPDGGANSNKHAYRHGDLVLNTNLVADHPQTKTKLVIRHVEKRFKSRHACVTKRLELAGAMDMEEELPYGYADGYLHGEALLIAERVAAARPGGAIRMGDVIERIIAHYNLEQPVSPPARMPAAPTPQRAVPSGLNAHMPPFRRRVDNLM